MHAIRPSHPLVTYGTYPLLALATGAGVTVAIQRGLDPGATVVALELVAIVVLGLVEWRRPLRPEWSMTARSLFRRDLPFLGAGMLVVRLAELVTAAAVAQLTVGRGFGPLATAPLAVQVVVGLLLFDLLWYHYHRLSHRNDRLWRVHAAHHAPSEVYVLVHPVFHPIDLLVSRLVIAFVALRLTGLAPDAVLIVLAVMNLQQMVSHVNADIRLGPLNALLTGAETHRFHHSATDRGNYGSVTTVWDRLFGTFVHHPGFAPDRLGLDDPSSFPDPRRFHQVVVWPFRRSAAPRALVSTAGG